MSLFNLIYSILVHFTYTEKLILSFHLPQKQLREVIVLTCLDACEVWILIMTSKFMNSQI